MRAGGIAWEYDFAFDGGAPPWVSAITEGTPCRRFARRRSALADPGYLADATQALGIFSPRAAGGRALGDRAPARATSSTASRRAST